MPVTDTKSTTPSATKRTSRRAPKASSTTRAKDEQAPPATSEEPETATDDGEVPGLSGQMGSVVSKLLELAEAGVDLGTNVISLLSSLAESQLREPVHPTEGAYRAAPPEGPPGEAAGAPGRAPGHDGDPTGSEPSYCIINRLPLRPGGPVQISFSINNDLPQSKRKLKVEAGGFVGATHGFELDDLAFSVQPSEKTIAPMDFEKFVLKGKIPKDAPVDSYNGWVTVDGDEEMRIPVVLVVTPPV
jgi:hypothetical protein